MRLAMFTLERMFLAVLLPIITNTNTIIMHHTNPKQNKYNRQHPSFNHDTTRAQNENEEEMKECETASEEEVEEVGTGWLGVEGEGVGGEMCVDLKVGIM